MINILLIALASFLLQSFLPWWTLALAAFAITYLRSAKPVAAFAQGFLALFLLWGGIAWFLSAANDFVLAGRISEIFGVTQPALIIIFTALLGAVVGGFSALTGSLCRLATSSKETL